MPEHNVARDLIRLANVPVIAPSANLAGHPPPRNIENIVKVFDNKVDIIIDSGIVKYGQPSTVVKIKADNQWELLREGVIEKESIKKLDYKMILFVCTGNICRSPMAVGLFKKMLAEKLGIEESQLESKGYKIISGGTASIYNAPASENAITIMKELGSDISEHLSQPVTLTQIEEADQVYVMTQGHFTTLKEWTPDATDKMSLLNPANEDIQDPIGSGLDVYRQCVLKLKHSLEVILDKI
ncbi:Arsenate reductase [subsurface metagenome]